MTTGERLSALNDSIRISATNDGSSLQSSIRNVSPRLRPTPVGKVRSGSSNQQLDDVSQDAIEWYGECDHQAGRGQVRQVLGDQERDQDCGQWNKGDTRP